MKYNIILSLILLLLLLTIVNKYKINNKYLVLLILSYICVVSILLNSRREHITRASLDIYRNEINNNNEVDACNKQNNISEKPRINYNSLPLLQQKPYSTYGNNYSIPSYISKDNYCEDLLKKIFNNNISTGKITLETTLLPNTKQYLNYDIFANESYLYTSSDTNSVKDFDFEGERSDIKKKMKKSNKYIKDKSIVYDSDEKPQPWEIVLADGKLSNCYVYIRTYSNNPNIPNYYLQCNADGKLTMSIYKGGSDQIWRLNLLNTDNISKNQVAVQIVSVTNNFLLNRTNESYLKPQTYNVRSTNHVALITDKHITLTDIVESLETIWIINNENSVNEGFTNLNITKNALSKKKKDLVIEESFLNYKDNNKLICNRIELNNDECYNNFKKMWNGNYVFNMSIKQSNNPFKNESCENFNTCDTCFKAILEKGSNNPSQCVWSVNENKCLPYKNLSMKFPATDSSSPFNGYPGGNKCKNKLPGGPWIKSAYDNGKAPYTYIKDGIFYTVLKTASSKPRKYLHANAPYNPNKLYSNINGELKEIGETLPDTTRFVKCTVNKSNFTKDGNLIVSNRQNNDLLQRIFSNKKPNLLSYVNWPDQNGRMGIYDKTTDKLYYYQNGQADNGWYLSVNGKDKPNGLNKDCAANYGAKTGDKVCCNQPGNLNGDQYICPKEAPICNKYIYDVSWGKCDLQKVEPPPLDNEIVLMSTNDSYWHRWRNSKNISEFNLSSYNKTVNFFQNKKTNELYYIHNCSMCGLDTCKTDITISLEEVTKNLKGEFNCDLIKKINSEYSNRKVQPIKNFINIQLDNLDENGNMNGKVSFEVHNTKFSWNVRSNGPDILNGKGTGNVENSELTVKMINDNSNNVNIQVNIFSTSDKPINFIEGICGKDFKNSICSLCGLNPNNTNAYCTKINDVNNIPYNAISGFTKLDYEKGYGIPKIM